MIRVRWFRNSHEQRNDWLRFGLMRLHRAGRVQYLEYPLESCVDAGFDPSVATHVHRHTSVVSVETGSERRRCIVDSEDSFFWMSGLIHNADLYFCAGYNSEFFEQRSFMPPYAWQRDDEIAFYVGRARDLIRDHGAVFDRIRPFVPIAPNLHIELPLSWLVRKSRNAHHKLTSRMMSSQSWLVDHSDFEARYRRLLSLRSAPALYDVVLLDTLWGWPRHRYALHLRLKELAEAGKIIHARLRWSEPTSFDGGDRFQLSAEDFPIETGKVDDYETMLASSRLAVFATGFHWGWRNIMTLALMWGLPIHADRLVLEPWFDMRRFEISWNDEAGWPGVAANLAAVSDVERARIKVHNQAAFDELLAPEKVAEYFIGAALGAHGPRRQCVEHIRAHQSIGA